MPFSEVYARLASSDDGLPLQELKKQATSKNLKRNLAFAILVLGAVFLPFAYVLIYTPIDPCEANTPTHTALELQCGNNSSEAQRLGCVFDLLTNNWVPEPCSDPATDAEFRAWALDPSRYHGAWPYYESSLGGATIVSEEALSDLVGKRVFTTVENHLGHCIFLARRMHRYINEDINNIAHNVLAHTVHCTTAVLEALTDRREALMEEHSFIVGTISCRL
jgi:hypothetical protein